MLSAEPTSVSTEPSVSCAEASQSVLVFSVTVIKDTNKQTLKCLIEHLEERELKVKHQNSITSDPEMMTIHLVPSPCQCFTLKILLGGHSFYLLKKNGETQSLGN